MNRKMGSLGKEVATGLEQALGMKVRYHGMIDHLANRERIRKSHVVSFVEGKQGLLERLTTDQLTLRILTADEILSIAESGKPVILRDCGAISLLKEVPHAVLVSATDGRIELRSRVAYIKQSDACSDIAARMKDVRMIENHLNVSETGPAPRDA